MKSLIKKAEKKKQRRNKFLTTVDRGYIITNRMTQEKIVELKEKTRLDINEYKDSKILSNIDSLTYKPLDYIIEKYS